MRFSTILFTIMIFLLAACGSNSPAPTAIILEPAGDYQIVQPQSGMIIYEDVLHLQGTAPADSTDSLILRLVSATDGELLETTVQPEDGSWEYDFEHGYSGEPVEVVISLLADNPADSGEYDIESVILSSTDYRPEGNYAEIYYPIAGDQVGGDMIMVQGVSSGYGAIRLVLKNGETVLSEKDLSLLDASLNETSWLVELPTTGRVGRTELYLYDDDGNELHQIDIVLDKVAG